MRYDTLGVGYTRRAPRGPAPGRSHPRGARRRALGPERRRRAGAYEPADLDVTAVEPLGRHARPATAGRRPGASDARAEQLPFDDDSFDAAMAFLSDHHWDDHARGLAELRRVARRRVVLFTCAAAKPRRLLAGARLPATASPRLVPPGYSLEQTLAALGGGRIEPVPIPHDCRDGFMHAYWRRPRAYLDPRVRAGISVFRLLEPAEVADGRPLAADLDSGEWERRNGELLELEELDLGYRIVVTELTTGIWR